MVPIFLALTFALLSFGLCLVALSLYDRHGLAPAMVCMALLEGLKYFVAGHVVLTLPGLGTAELGSLVSFVALLATVQMAYLRLGAGPTRQLLWGLVALSVLTSWFMALLAALVAHPDVILHAPLDPRSMVFSGAVLLVGNGLLVVGLIGVVVLLQVLLRRGFSLWGSVVVSLLLVNLVDTLAFQALIGPQRLVWDDLRAVLIGKTVVAFFLGAVGATWLRGWRRGVEPAALDLLAVLSFQRRLQSLERELQRDALTGLLNRRYLEREVPAILRLDEHQGRSTALVLVDLDHFKALNDSQGHWVGDLALQHVGRVLQNGVRQLDSVIRYGGEEFVLVLPGTQAEEARHLMENLLQTLRQSPLQGEGVPPLTLDATAGVAATPKDGHTWPELLRRADARLYEGKRAGRGRVVGA
ncbi:GGDEF domain-containing protein [Inhella gelatinilytica]|uniref:diguanylate cyclase n=1 Tax=Inhella gelatinilytica TaxID=2795030 RepID=A0A931IUY1_9BURK|nr:GGDEF domain-containing protein [Inhella gelatinilytica]MBH9551459.1 GGDEF domain-containing protein [Inhella gelatinilytica]